MGSSVALRLPAGGWREAELGFTFWSEEAGLSSNVIAFPGRVLCKVPVPY